MGDVPLRETGAIAVVGSIEHLRDRLGSDHFDRRVLTQAGHLAGTQHQGDGILVIERVVPLDALVGAILKWSGLAKFGLRGARDLKVEQHRIQNKKISAGLQGFRILHLSDLHLDLDTGLIPVLLDAIAGVSYDLVVITGDFRNRTRGGFSFAIEQTHRVVSVLKAPVYGILGNHDGLEMVPALEAVGIRMLLNEAVVIPWNGENLILGGIDDPHFFRTHDIPRCIGDVNGADGFRLLLSHSPEPFAEAEGVFDFMLCGHTHGGQICLPGGTPIVRNGRCPRSMLAGPWHFGRLSGYTSRGTGCCGVAARFFCPPEITVHTLFGIT